MRLLGGLGCEYDHLAHLLTLRTSFPGVNAIKTY